MDQVVAEVRVHHLLIAEEEETNSSYIFVNEGSPNLTCSSPQNDTHDSFSCSVLV